MEGPAQAGIKQDEKLRVETAKPTRNFSSQNRTVLLCFAGACAILAVAGWLRRIPAVPDALLYEQFQITSGVLAFAFAGAALVRFRGTLDRLPLILSCGFVIVGITLTTSSAVSLRLWEADHNASLRDPISWVVSRTLLAVLLAAALLVEWHIPTARKPGWEISVALGVVVAASSLLTTTHWQLPADVLVQPGGLFPRPGNLFPAALFLLAAIGYQRRLRHASTPFDRSLCYAAALNFACCLAASQSERRLDAPFLFAGILQFTSYAVLLAGALLDNAQLLGKVRDLAASDPMTGLANYRKLVDAMDAEIQRSARTGRPFALLLFDLNGLKQINDQLGHLVGSRAICRFANILRMQSRAIDVCARYGGDEFVLVLPETGPEAAMEVVRRVSECVAQDQEQPPISAGVGLAFYPQDGQTIETLLAVADQALYRVKGHPRKKAATRR